MEKKKRERAAKPEAQAQDLRPGLMLLLGEREYLKRRLEAEIADIVKNLDELNLKAETEKK